MEASKKTADFPYCSDVIYLDKQNQIGIEFNWNIRIRIDGILTTDENSFIRMMDALMYIARDLGYDYIIFADFLADEIVEMFLRYGFEETKSDGDPNTHYLDMHLENKNELKENK
ncbi:MAG: hypothetical protein Q4B53_07210 [Lachnospiraceae bacterium]|nr:hypothetical protein [Lachnospiraceae bacterium]